MATITQKRMLVQNNLKALPYKDRQRIEAAVMQLLGQIHSLQPKVEQYVFNNGAQQRLFKLDGTIPINYQGRQYNIPIAMWLPLEFPARPPMAYVTPVSGMRIKDRHRHVDPQGFVYHPYLHSWSAASSLVDLVGLLCSTFGADPPVFSGPPTRAPASGYQPPGAGRGRGGPVYGGGPPGGYPGGRPGGPGPGPGLGRGQGPVPYGARPGGGPPGAGRGYPPQQPAPYGIGAPGQPPQGYTGPPQYGQPQQPQPQQPPPPQQGYPPPGGGYGQRMASAVNGAFGAALGRSGPTQQEIQAEKDSELKKAVEGKLRLQLQTIYDSENSEMNKYNEQQKRLEDNRSKISEMEEQLRRENEQLSRQAETLVTKISELEQWLTENEGKDDIDIDTCIMPTDTWAEQCLVACAADQACTDAMRELDRALEDERMKLPVYLREMRKLARAQFEHRALSQEVLKKQQRNIGPAAHAGPNGGQPQQAGRGGGPYFSQFPQAR